MSLFERKEFTGHSGGKLDFKIECDDLSDDDIETLAYIISNRFKFSSVSGIPTGGIRLEKALKQYVDNDDNYPHLIVDDVLTTGQSMIEEYKKDKIRNTIGVVIFARGAPPQWVYPIFKMWSGYL